MSEKVASEQFRDSQVAIREYMGSNLQYRGSHEATVSVTMGDEVVFKERLQDVYAFIDTNRSYITIIWPKAYEGIYHMEYSNEYQIFSYDKVSNVLKIECQDFQNRDIIITLSH